MDDKDKPQEVVLAPGQNWQLANAVAERVKWEIVELALKGLVLALWVAVIFRAGMRWAYGDEAAA